MPRIPGTLKHFIVCRSVIAAASVRPKILPRVNSFRIHHTFQVVHDVEVGRGGIGRSRWQTKLARFCLHNELGSASVQTALRHT
jgi:hypothetical protein